MCVCQGQVTERKLVNMPVYPIVSSCSVSCNYDIMTETKLRRQTFNLLCHCLQINCAVHLSSWKLINKTKRDRLGSVSIISFCIDIAHFCIGMKIHIYLTYAVFILNNLRSISLPL